jgi:hypothetical protein
MTVRSRIVVSSLVVIASLVSTACGDGASVTARESWTVDPIPLLDISDDDPGGDIRLGEAVHVTRRSDGSVLVADRALHALRIFGPDGQFRHAVGRQGSGPGEFEYIRVAQRCGDSLFVEDIILRRVTVHALDGTIGRVLTTSEFAGGTDAYGSACNSAGQFVHHAWNRFDPTKVGRQRVPVAAWLSSTEGARRTELGNVAGPEFVGRADGAGRALLGRTAHLAIGRRHVYIGEADSSVIHVYTLDGAAAGVRRLPDDVDLRVRDADLELAKRRDSLGQTAREQAQTRDEWALDTPPATLPAYDALVVDADDHLWVRRHPRAGQPDTPWIVFDPDGTHVATVSLPAVLTVHEIGREYIAGIVLDPETGTHAVRVLSLTRHPTP